MCERRRLAAVLLFCFVFQLCGLGGPGPWRPCAAEAAAWTGGVAASFSAGDGSQGSPYEIGTAEELALVAAWVNEGKSADAHYKLTADIDLGGREWTPIGSADVQDGNPHWLDDATAKGFGGVFDGNGKVVSGLRITGGNVAGLFGLVSGDSTVAVRNLTVALPDVSGDNFVGGLAGMVRIASSQTKGPQVTGVGVVGGTVCGYDYVGGLVGENSISADIDGSFASGSVSGNEIVGGLVGRNYDSQITSYYASGSVSGNNSLGGLVGENYDAEITDSYATGPVSGNQSLGGLVGRHVYNSLIAGCFATGSVDGFRGLGGLVGETSGIVWTTGSFAIGPVSGSGMVGGLVGSSSDPAFIVHCYATGPVYANDDGGYYVGGLVGASTETNNIESSYATGAVRVGATATEIGGLVGSGDANIASSAYDPQGTGMGAAAVAGAAHGNVIAVPTRSDDWQGGWGGMAGFDSLFSGKALYYPQIKSFDNPALPDFAPWSALSAVPAILSGDATTGGEDAHNVKTPFVLLSRDAGGRPLAWRIAGRGAALAVSGDRLVVSPDAVGLSFDLCASNGGGREKMFRLTTSNDLTATAGLSPASSPALSQLSPASLTAGSLPQTVTLAFSGSLTVTASVDIAGPDGSAVYDKPATGGSFPHVFDKAGGYTVTVHMWTAAGDGYLYSTEVRTITATAEGGENPGPGPGGPEDPSQQPHYRSADLRSLSLTIEGTAYSGTLQADGATWTVTVPYGTDLSAVTPTFSLWPGAKVSPQPPYDLRQAVEITVTAPDGTTRKTYALEVQVEAPPSVAAAILDALPANWSAVWTENGDGSWSVTVTAPFDATFDAAEIERVVVAAEGLSGIRVQYVNAVGEVVELARQQAGTGRAGAGDKLRISATAADRASAERAKVASVTVYKKNDATTYYQELNIALSQVPGGKLPEAETGGSGGGGGCGAGAGLVFGLGLGLMGLAALPLLGGKRRR